MNLFNNLSSDIILLITNYIDVFSLKNLEYVDKSFKNFRFTYFGIHSINDIKLDLLNNTRLIKSNVLCQSFTIYDIPKLKNCLLFASKNNQSIVNFLIDLLWHKNNCFYIGGSFATIITQLLNKNINYLENQLNLDDYVESDIDIYVIGYNNMYNIQKFIGLYIKKHFNNRCFIKIKPNLINIVFENNNYRTIQIILHIKANIDEHMIFIDLPISQFAICSNSSKGFSIYKTKLADYALTKQINIIQEPYIPETMNRILKYLNRNYLTVIASKFNNSNIQNTRIIGIFDKYGYRHDIDCKLDKIELINNLLVESKFIEDLPIYFNDSRLVLFKSDTHEVIHFNTSINFRYSKLTDVLKNLNILITLCTTNISNGIIDRPKIIRAAGYYNTHQDSNEIYSRAIIEYLKIQTEINEKQIEYFNKLQKKYYYIDNEIHDTYQCYMNLYINKYSKIKSYTYPYYQIMNPFEFTKIHSLLFFNNYTSYFLNKNFCFLGSDKQYHNINKTNSIKENIILIPNNRLLKKDTNIYNYLDIYNNYIYSINNYNIEYEIIPSKRQINFDIEYSLIPSQKQINYDRYVKNEKNITKYKHVKRCR